MAEGKSILVDTSKCTACRGCQVACKQWNQLQGTETKNLGSHQNPQDLSAQTWKLVRFSEGKNGNGKPFWYFFSEQCRHCLDPGCKAVDEKDAIKVDEKTGAVVYTAATKDLDFKATREGCPFDIPRKDEKTGILFKCSMCFDRISSGDPNLRLPACVKSCPTGAMQFGDRDKILAAAQSRVTELKKTFPKAQALNADDVRVIYIVTDDPAKYWKLAAGK